MNRTLHTVPELVAFALFDLDPRVAEAQRPLHSFLVSLALLDAETALADDDLYAAVTELLPLDGATVSADDLAAAIELNLRLDLLRRDEDGRLELTELRRNQLTQAQEGLERQREAFEAHMLAAVEQRGVVLTHDERESLYRVLEDRLQQLLQEQSSTVAAAWVRGGEGFDAAMQELNAREHLKEVANALAPGGAAPNKLRRTAIALGLEDGMRALPSEAAAYLAAFYQRAVAFAVLRQDPGVRRVKAQLASRRVAYLDANVVMAAMFEADAEHELAQQLLGITHGLGAEVRVSRFTVEELQAALNGASRWMRSYRGRQDLRGVVDDVVVRSYHLATRQSPGLRWGAFVGGFDPPATWLQEHGITVDAETCGDTEHDSRLDAVRSAVGRNRRGASAVVVQTDALSILHVTRSRNALPADEMGNRVWLVTLDRSLARADRYLVDAGTLPAAVSRQAQAWADLLSPCLPPDEARLSGYVAHLVQSQFSLLAEDPMFVKKEFLLTLTSSRFDVSEVLGAGTDRARQMLVRLQQDEELEALMGDPKPEENSWNEQLERTVRRALAAIEPSAEQLAELEAQRQARLEAERRAEEERRERLQTVRHLAEARTEAQTARDEADKVQGELDEVAGERDKLAGERDRLAEALEAERSVPWYRRILRPRP